MAREGVVGVADLNLPAAHRAALDVEVSREAIEACLREMGGNISRAAQSLGLSRQALYRRMERFNMRAPGGS
jgi:transcriptional regulator of acetoin/glycerol metabolism